MSMRLLFAALLALSLGACESMSDTFGFGDGNDTYGGTAFENEGYSGLGDDDVAATGDSGLGDDCYIRRVGSESAANSLVCN